MSKHKVKAAFTLQEKQADEWSGNTSWKNMAAIVGVIQTKSGTIQLEGAEEKQTLKYEITTNWRPDIFKGQRERRLVHSDGREFYIESIVNVDELNRDYLLTCTMRDEDGS